MHALKEFRDGEITIAIMSMFKFEPPYLQINFFLKLPKNRD